MKLKGGILVGYHNEIDILTLSCLIDCIMLRGRGESLYKLDLGTLGKWNIPFIFKNTSLWKIIS